MSFITSNISNEMNHINIQPKTNIAVQRNEIGSNIDPNVIPNECKVFLGKGTKSLNPLFCNIVESFRYDWKEVSKLKNKHEKRSLRQGIFQRMYTEWKSNNTGNVFLSSSVAQEQHVAGRAVGGRSAQASPPKN
mmetsp:Transcript_13421/g.25195  ORF Transcript_13421/g.25195 Transcript_13421/m.25195 type:complete len:134 (+) Transcript_13421:3978-4379(+)